MTTKTQQLERKTITKYERLDLDELCVKRILPGKKRYSLDSMTVRELIEKLSEFELDSKVEFSRGYDTYELVMSITRPETDDEYRSRIEALEYSEKVKKQKKKDRELETLKRLAKKYNLNITEDL